MIVKQMVERIRVDIQLREYMDDSDGWGVEEGQAVHAKLLAAVDAHLPPTQQAMGIFAISLKGVRRTDASFPRESVMQLAHRFREEHGFCLWHMSSPSLLENWEAAASRRKQPMLVWNKSEDGCQARLIGPEMSEGLRGTFDVMLAAAQRNTDQQSGAIEVATADVAAQLGISVSNASNKLKALWTDGFILRREQVAPSGGLEFRYFVAR